MHKHLFISREGHCLFENTVTDIAWTQFGQVDKLMEMTAFVEDDQYPTTVKLDLTVHFARLEPNSKHLQFLDKRIIADIPQENTLIWGNFVSAYLFENLPHSDNMIKLVALPFIGRDYQLMAFIQATIIQLPIHHHDKIIMDRRFLEIVQNRYASGINITGQQLNISQHFDIDDFIAKLQQDCGKLIEIKIDFISIPADFVEVLGIDWREIKDYEQTQPNSFTESPKPVLLPATVDERS